MAAQAVVEAAAPQQGPSSQEYWQGLLGQQFRQLTAQEQLAMGKGKRKRNEVGCWVSSEADTADEHQKTTSAP